MGLTAGVTAYGFVIVTSVIIIIIDAIIIITFRIIIIIIIIIKAIMHFRLKYLRAQLKDEGNNNNNYD